METKDECIERVYRTAYKMAPDVWAAFKWTKVYREDGSGLIFLLYGRWKLEAGAKGVKGMSISYDGTFRDTPRGDKVAIKALMTWRDEHPNDDKWSNKRIIERMKLQKANEFSLTSFLEIYVEGKHKKLCKMWKDLDKEGK